MSASEELANIAKLGRAAALVAEDCGLEMKSFQICPDLDDGTLNSVTMVLLYDPEKELKPKIEIVQLSGAVDEGLEEAHKQRQADQLEQAKRDLSGLDLDDRLRGRGGFLDSGE